MPAIQDPTTGIHHITAVASDPQRNVDFYVSILGLKLVKRTVNFDDPGSYHLYYGDTGGSPATILTFFPWPGAKKGLAGAGAVGATAYAIPVGAADFWHSRLQSLGVKVHANTTRLNARVIRFEDHDAMQLELIEDPAAAALPAWEGGGVPAEHAIRGFHSATLWVRDAKSTASLLTTVFGMTQVGEPVKEDAGTRTRFVAAGDAPLGRVVDILANPGLPMHKLGAGIVHHIAMRAADSAQLVRMQTAIAAAGYGVTEVRDRNYFESIYFREREGVLFEVATDVPGFAIDEPVYALGMGLRLPGQYEPMRDRIEAHLLPIRVPSPSNPALASHLHRFEARGHDAAVPTLFLLHGTGADERDLLPLGLTLAPKANRLSVRGNVLEAGKPRFFRRLAEGVFDLADLATRTDQLAAWYDAARAAYRIDPKTAVAVGFSNGANVTASMLLRGVGNLRHAILIRAMVPFEPAEQGVPAADLTGVHILILSGATDPIVPAANRDRLAQLLRERGAEVSHVVMNAGHNLTERDIHEAQTWLRARGLA